MWKKVNTTALNIRRGPGASYQDIGDLLRNDVVEIVESAAGGWGRLGQWYRGTTVIALPDLTNSWCQTGYLVDTTPPVVEPPPPATTETREFIEQKTMIDPDGTRWTGEAHFVLTKQL